MSLVLVPQVRSLKFREQQSRHELAQLMLVKWGASSDTGTLRVQNEDSFLAEEKIFVVADGMGGHNAGEVASAMAIKMLAEAQANGISDSSQLAKVIEQINHSIFQAAANQTDQRGMGTTLAVLALTPNETTNEVSAAVANIGDSRTYLFRNDEFRQVSVDHSYVQDLVSEGLITREEARTHARRNIVTRALGIEPSVAVDTWTLPLITGDRYVLCSDGLVDEVTDEAIEKCVKQKIEPQKVADQLVALANANGGRDNITVIIVDVIADGANSPAATSVSPKTKLKKKSLVKKLVLSGAIAITAVVAIVLLSSFLRSGYFVAYENSKSDARVLIYRGKSFLWVSPTIEADSTLTREDLSLGLAREIVAQPSFSSSADARDYVNQIRDVVEQTKP
ncbi:MAG: Stp1/IreP family PP2C-type Ser/Thr phosphatase [Ilumatobacteraceae bacterium]|jgi:serine/threonine protein phosphatase PrpC|nr:Stp1/IreP family PP2C-type Ser/Thr phosphatase [Ilumatobacteraceae bacterium]MDP4736525.1 Stp1/IreP family PP2C-type Ser/Thr phosphatase [Ilumatobacteraceae bacterium]MDP4981525.1 Stp1/IreP family PP2C-type Ser/Thr phosphatase [Ilumatobacteraceae bacterium]